MSGADDKQDFGLVLVLLRGIKGWNRPELSARSGVDKDLIADYERGLRRPIRRNRERLAAAFGVPASFLAELVPVCRGLRLSYESAAGGGQAAAPPAAEIGRRLEGQVGSAVREALEPFLLELRALDARAVRPAPRAEDRSWAEELWAVLEPLPADSQARICQALYGDERSWALAVRLAEASSAAAAHSAGEALRLARLAVEVAREDPRPEPWLARLRGHCEPFLANAHRVAGNLTDARQAFASADAQWAQGEGGDPGGLLDGTRRLDLKASLLRQDGQFAEALKLLAEALADSPPEEAARLLIKKATTYMRAGDYELALEVLREAEPRIDAEREPRLPWVLYFNLSVTYCHLDLYEDAGRLLPRVEALAADLGTVLDGKRTLWLQGRTWAGLGRREEAIAALAEVRQYFFAEKIAYDYALVSLELATLYLEQGRTRLVKDLAEEMLWIFKTQQVHKEALAALALFRHAARAEKAQAEWTRRLVKYLYKAQHNPRLRFAG